MDLLQGIKVKSVGHLKRSHMFIKKDESLLHLIDTWHVTIMC